MPRARATWTAVQAVTPLPPPQTHHHHTTAAANTSILVIHNGTAGTCLCAKYNSHSNKCAWLSVNLRHQTNALSTPSRPLGAALPLKPSCGSHCLALVGYGEAAISLYGDGRRGVVAPNSSLPRDAVVPSLISTCRRALWWTHVTMLARDDSIDYICMYVVE